MTEKTFIDEMEDEYDLKGELEVSLQHFTDWYYKRNKLFFNILLTDIIKEIRIV